MIIYFNLMARSVHLESHELASCSASISFEDSDGDDTWKILGVNSPFPLDSSADTEYDVLILGLDWLVNDLSSEQ